MHALNASENNKNMRGNREKEGKIAFRAKLEQFLREFKFPYNKNFIDNIFLKLLEIAFYLC